jgi:Xaa-Pro dipeptidase
MTTYPPLLELDAIDQLPFSPAEYDRRLATCRQEMLERGLDYLVLNSPENIYYLSGFITRGYYVFQALVVTHSSDPILVVRRYEQVNVEKLSYYKDLATWQDTDVPAEVLARTLIDVGAAGKTVGIDANAMFFTASDYETLRENLPTATFVNASSVMEKGRTIKSPQEIAYIRRAAETLSAGFAAAKAAIQPGRTENDVAAAFLHGAVSAGSEYMAGPPYIVSGPRTALPHGTWARRRIEQGDLVLVEGSGNWKRYSAPMMRTWSLGKPSDSVRRAADTSIAALDAAISAIKPGVTGGEVDAACRGTVARAGLEHAFIHRTGYSVGVGICPGWGEGSLMDLKANDARVLQPGMVFHMVPVLFPEPDVSVGFSGLVLVTDTGAEMLADFSRDLEL